MEKRLGLLVNAMTGDELISQLVKYSPAIDRLGVPGYAWHMEAAHGVVTGGNSTVFPCSLARAAAFNPDTEAQIARVIGVEARAKWNAYLQRHGKPPPYNSEGLSLTLYAPEINLCRDPRWGRCQESRGEDPTLTSRLTVPFVQNLQRHPDSDKYLLTTAMLKDFIVYNLESSQPVGGSNWQYRLSYNAVVSEADLRQTFLPAFLAGAAEGGTRAMMTSYHGLNGVPASASPLIRNELREKLGWEGMMISDGGAISFMLNFNCDKGQQPIDCDRLNLSKTMLTNMTTASAAALNAGCDVNSGGHTDGAYRKAHPPHRTIANMSGYAYEYLGDALDEGMVTLQRLRVAATRALRLRFDLGLFDPPEMVPFSKYTLANDIDTAAHRALARRSASEGLVLLRNEGGLLPLDASKLNVAGRSVAIIGPSADDPELMKSNYEGCRNNKSFVNSGDPSRPCRLVTPLQGLRQRLPQANVSYTKGCGLTTSTPQGIAAGVAAAKAADVAVLVVGLQPWTDNGGGAGHSNSDAAEGEAHDRVDIGLPGSQKQLVKAVLAAQPKTILVLMSECPPPALVQAFYGGEEQGTALAMALLGEAAFSGRLPVTVVHSKAQLPPYTLQQMSAAPGRTHRYLTTEPMYPFGYGLTSLAAARYASLTVAPASVPVDAPASLNVTVEVEVSALSLPAPTPPTPAPPPPTQDEIVQVYVGWVGHGDGNGTPAAAATAADREAGESSVPLHELKAFRRVTLPPAARSTGGVKDSSSLRLRFEIPVSSLQLMRPDGTMGLLAGQWRETLTDILWSEKYTRIGDKLAAYQREGVTHLSFEFFPPNTPVGVQNLCLRIKRLQDLGPAFISVTWGANGSTREPTMEISSQAQKHYSSLVLMHLTCAGMSKIQLREALKEAKGRGIQNILVLRGDPPQGQPWKKCTDGFERSIELVRFIREEHGTHFGIAVAGHPEGHPDALRDAEGSETAAKAARAEELQHLKEKVDAGADFILTQFFFDAENFLQWCRDCRAAGIKCPIVPGIMPIQQYDAFVSLTEYCGVSVPPQIWADLSPLKDDEQKVKDYGVSLATHTCRKLLDSGLVGGLHFYTLNLERATRLVLKGLELDGARRRMLPWQTSAEAKREKEAVRPIYWSNNPESYIRRTETWVEDQFPDHRWRQAMPKAPAQDGGAGGRGGGISSGDSGGGVLSPMEQGGLGMAPLTEVWGSEQEAQRRYEAIFGTAEERRAMWGSSMGEGEYAKVYEVFAQYVDGAPSVPMLPWCPSRLLLETSAIKSQLVELNRAGFLTINSQPRVNGCPSDDPVHGWGKPNGFVYQKAYVEGFCSAAMLRSLMVAAESFPTIMFIATDINDNIYSRWPWYSRGSINSGNSVKQERERERERYRMRGAGGGRDGRGATAVTWGVFPGTEVNQPTIVDPTAFITAWKDEAFANWDAWVSIYDDENPARDLLYEIQQTYFLFSVVDNDFVGGDIWALFASAVQMQQQQMHQQQMEAQQQPIRFA
eukprot:g1016.t1